MSAHTKGPWSLVEWPYERECRAVLGSDGISPAVVWGGIAESEANASLIAAAPDLLEACKRALSIEQSVTQGQERELRDGFVDLLRTAIAKAEGR